MKRVLGLVLAAVTAVVGCNKGEAGKDGGSGGPKVADSVGIQGKWNLLEVHDSGKQASADEVQGSTIEFAGEKMTMLRKGRTEPEAFTFKIDEAKKYFDMKDPTRNHESLGIYELSGDELRICINEQASTDRAKEFKSEKNSPNDLLMVLRRAK